MSCDRFQELSTALSVGELSPEDAAAARAHLAGCADCTRVALRDRELVAMVRSSTVQAPPTLRRNIVTAVRAEAKRLEAGREEAAKLEAARLETARREATRRRRRWLLGGVAATLAAAAVVVAVVVPLQRGGPGNTLASAWSLYRQQRPIRLDSPTRTTHAILLAELGPAARSPDLSGQGFWSLASGTRVLAGRLVDITEYRDQRGAWLDLVRWRGHLEPPNGVEIGAGRYGGWTQWGGIGAVWWAHDGVVFCLLGEAGHAQLDRIAEQVQGL